MGQSEIIFVLSRGQAGCDFLVAKELPLGVEFYHGCQINREACDPGNAEMQTTRDAGCCYRESHLIYQTVCMVHLSFYNSVSNSSLASLLSLLLCPAFPSPQLLNLGVWGQGKGRAGDKIICRALTIWCNRSQEIRDKV